MTDMPGGLDGSNVWVTDVNMHGGGTDPWNNPSTGPSAGPSAGPEINMDGDGGGHSMDTVSIWAAEERPERPKETQAKRVAVANPARQEAEDAREWADLATQKARAAVREKREAESRLQQAQQYIAGLENERKQREQQLQIERQERDQQLRNHWVGEWNKFSGELEQRFQQQLEDQQADNVRQLKQQMDNELAKHEAEHQKQMADMEAKNRQDQETARAEQEKKQAEQETKMAAFHARFSTQRRSAHDPQNGMNGGHFPDTPPVRTPEFVPPVTREERRVEAVIRQGPVSRFPEISITAPTQPEPSAATPVTPEQNTPRVPQLLDLSDPLAVQQLQVLLGQASPKKSPRKKRKVKVGKTAALTQARRGQQQQLDPQDDNRWKMIVREHWRLMMGLNRAKDFFDYEPVSEATAQRCEDGDTQPEAGLYQVYFGEGWANSLWNATIFEKCVEEVLKKRAEDPGKYDVPDVTKEYILALFAGLLADARGEWSRWQPRAGETSEAARARAEANTRRCKTAERMIKISLAKGDESSVNAWKWLRDELLEALDIGGMSSEEDEPIEVQCGDTRQVTMAHSIKICPWRLQKITDQLEMIDKASENTLVTKGFKRFRTRTGQKRLTTDPPLRLPRGLYEPAWLSQQKALIPEIEEWLEISDKELTLMEISLANSN
ncbi:hypothetical protein B0H17DRAFT_1211582 [Mycena rosella]|uniref:Uncharacterized protein n=1 Tax=Mycena rosella TaxID=1033263 RepID=A0AAD7CXQ9_MYCRO|nr:hypothetical protein B0H17DRAFT_1211582 [Mycena rosella]